MALEHAARTIPQVHHVLPLPCHQLICGLTTPCTLPPRAICVARMQIPPRPSEEHVRILVVGERGVGKTTLLQNLLASYGGARVFEQVCTPMETIMVTVDLCDITGA
jgi:hypothetical protein